MGRITKIITALVVVVVLLGLSFISTLIYLKTGQQYYDVNNVEACSHYTPAQAKERVLRAYLRQANTRNGQREAVKTAHQQGIRFVDNEIQGPGDHWLVPFYDEKKLDKKQFGMLNCGTLLVEFASE